jgi:hypothetical protein
LRHLSEINLGDYIRACAELAAGRETRIAIAGLLGLAVPEQVQPPLRQGAARTALHSLEPMAATEAVRPLPGNLEPPVAEVASPGSEDKPTPIDEDTPAIPADLTELERVQMDASIQELRNIPADAPTGAAPEITPLFEPLQTRTMLSRALARLAESGPVDLDRVIQQCAKRDFLSDIPRRPQPVLSFGVQLLVDRGDAMTVFAQDQARLEASMRALVGESKIQVLSFEGFPSRAGSGGKRRWQPYEEQMPPSGTVVALLTDFGIGRAAWLATPAAPRQWRAFADRLRQRRCPVVAFVPYPSSRWPGDLKRGITMIQWDRPTRTSAIRASVGRGLRVDM